MILEHGNTVKTKLSLRTATAILFMGLLGMAILSAMHVLPTSVYCLDNTPPEIELILKPESVIQGRTLMLVAQSDQPISRITGRIFRKDAEFYRNGDIYRSLVGIPVSQKPGQYAIEITVEGQNGNQSRLQKTIQVMEGDFGRGSIIALPKSKSHLATDDELQKIDSAKRSEAYKQLELNQLWQDKSISPTEGRISSAFGAHHIFKGKAGFAHSGLDIANKVGTPVKAANFGIVALAETLPIGGTSVIINHGQEVFSVYCHLDSISVNKGNKVDKGQLIGTMGTTGRSTGSHLHWEFRINGVPVDPTEWTERDFSWDGTEKSEP